MDFACSNSSSWKSSPRSQCHSLSPPMPPHRSFICSRSSAHNCFMVRMPAACSRFSMRGPIPGRSRGVRVSSAASRMSGVSATSPSGFSISLATLDRYRFGARPTEQRKVEPTVSRIFAFTRSRQIERRQQRLLAAHQPAGHLVDRHHRRHRHHRLHCFDDAVVILDIELVARLDQRNARTQPPGLAHLRARLHAEVPLPHSWRRCSMWCPPPPAPPPPAARAGWAPAPAPPRRNTSSGPGKASATEARRRQPGSDCRQGLPRTFDSASAPSKPANGGKPSYFPYWESPLNPVSEKGFTSRHPGGYSHLRVLSDGICPLWGDAVNSKPGYSGPIQETK